MVLNDATTTTDGPPALGSTAHRVAFALPADAEAVGEARHRVREHLRSWGIAPDGCDTAVLVVSELVTNSVVHTASQTITCSLGSTPDQLLIHVSDDGSGPSVPTPRTAALHDEEGRGLMLVKSVSACWGVGPTEGGDGRGVWAALPARARA